MTMRFLVQVDLGQERLTDIMNREDEVVAFRIDPEADRSSDAAVSEEPVALDVLNILLAIAPPQYSDSARRLHRPRHWVEMTIGAHEVLGNIHIPAGAQPGGLPAADQPPVRAADAGQDRDRRAGATDGRGAGERAGGGDDEGDRPQPDGLRGAVHGRVPRLRGPDGDDRDDAEVEVADVSGSPGPAV